VITANPETRSASGRYFIGKEVDNIPLYEGKELPTWEQADGVLRKFASHYGFTVLEDELLDCVFDGIYIDFYGLRGNISLRNLIFNFES
jgi:hypothetical protein